jgi:hypothetical protein
MYRFCLPVLCPNHAAILQDFHTSQCRGMFAAWHFGFRCSTPFSVALLPWG